MKVQQHASYPQIRSQIYTHMLVSWLKHTLTVLPGERRAWQWQVSSISVWINWFLLHGLEVDALFIPLLLCVWVWPVVVVALKRAFLENGPRWQETSQGGTLQVCMSPATVWQRRQILWLSLIWSLFSEFPQEFPAWHLITHIHAWITRWVMCVHVLPYEPLKLTQRCILFIVVIMSSSCVTRYSIDRSSDPDKYFYIEITSGSLMTVRSLDREEVGWHNITILAMEMSTSL